MCPSLHFMYIHPLKEWPTLRLTLNYCNIYDSPIFEPPAQNLPFPDRHNIQPSLHPFFEPPFMNIHPLKYWPILCLTLNDQSIFEPPS